ncbi:DNA-binding protein [Rhodovulum sulfidophilum]|uniref:DNA-binding protein n=1 Tax=Rhodovulum sulfidophilum TaxID=35806 RepID=A0A0D6AYV8_RHOSU|nr:DNA-binding protein [Rhodovulum sulfidophilum]
MHALVAARKGQGLTQQELANRMDRPQSFVAKVEGGERRLDVVEFVQWTIALGIAQDSILTEVVRGVTLQDRTQQ